uniref:Uncharacterized protein n=1 Tax=Picea glauca TaxID=3330 RepID=A0A101M2S5_PICGL|nr:hypothetical protein ABT39_MTgene3219 [Picea glauca]
MRVHLLGGKLSLSLLLLLEPGQPFMSLEKMQMEPDPLLGVLEWELALVLPSFLVRWFIRRFLVLPWC